MSRNKKKLYIYFFFLSNSSYCLIVIFLITILSVCRSLKHFKAHKKREFHYFKGQPYIHSFIGNTNFTNLLKFYSKLLYYFIYLFLLLSSVLIFIKKCFAHKIPENSEFMLKRPYLAHLVTLIALSLCIHSNKVLLKAKKRYWKQKKKRRERTIKETK